MSIEIRLLRKGEEELVNEVYKNAYHINRPIENFLWEFVNGPAGPAIYVVAVDNGKQGNPFVGTQAAIPVMMSDNHGDEILTGKSEDTYVDPAYRGQKLFDRMYELLFQECRKAGMKIIWGFTDARKPFLKVGFEIPSDTIQGLLVNKPNKSSAFLTSLKPNSPPFYKFQIWVLNVIGKIYQIANSVSNSRLPAEFTCREKMIEDKSEIIKRCLDLKHEIVYDLSQTADYTRWRLIKNPFKNQYYELNYFKNEKWIASFIFNLRPEGFAYLEQMLTVPELPLQARVRIVRNASRRVLMKGVFLIRFWGFDRNIINLSEMDILKKAGFIFVKKGTGIVWKNLQGENENPKLEFPQVHFTRLYTQGNI